MTTSHSRFTLAISASSIFLAFAYLWGYAFHQGYFSRLGFNPDLFPLPTPEIYIQAFMAGIEVVFRPLQWLGQIPLVDVIVVLLALAGVVVLASWVSTWRAVREWWQRRRIRRHLESGAENLPLFLRRALHWMLVPGTFFATLFVGLLTLALCVLFIIGVPLSAGKAHAQSDLARKIYDSWPRTTWSGEDAKPHAGRLVSCSDHWCGVIEDGQAVVIPPSIVKRIDAGSASR
jgi:hypothetical protein